MDGMVEHSYEELNSFFEELLKFDLVLDEEPKTFFDIAGFQHYEQVISNVYKYFFNPDEDHGLKRLFLDSLLELAEINLPFENVSVETEVLTEKGGKIDILISDKFKGQNISESSIVIENKVYADLYNDLDDYYNSVQSKNKIGIVLSPNKINNVSQKHSAYRNITHLELLTLVKRNVGTYLNSITERAFVLLKEFIINVEAMTLNEKQKDNLRFYYENHVKIDQLVNLKEDANQFVIDQCYQIMPYEKWKWNRVNDRGFSIKYGENGLFVFFQIDDLLVDNKISCGLWYWEEGIAKKWNKYFDMEAIRKRFGDRFEYPADFDGRNWFHLTQKGWMINSFKEYIEMKSLIHFILEEEMTSVADYLDKNLSSK